MTQRQELRNSSPQQSPSEFTRVIDLLKERLQDCRKIYGFHQNDSVLDDINEQLDNQESIVGIQVVLVPLYTVSDDHLLCSFVIFLSNQLDNKCIWIKYGIERSGRVRGTFTTFNIRFVDFDEFEETEYFIDKF